MTLSPSKYARFWGMMKLYQEFEGMNNYKDKLHKPWNKIPEEIRNIAALGLFTKNAPTHKTNNYYTQRQ